jgi:hypothetical protein
MSWVNQEKMKLDAATQLGVFVVENPNYIGCADSQYVMLCAGGYPAVILIGNNLQIDKMIRECSFNLLSAPDSYYVCKYTGTRIN